MFWVIVAIAAAVLLVGWYLFRPHRVGGDSRREAAKRAERLKHRLVRTPDDMAEMGDVRGLTLKVPDRTKACRPALENADKTYLTFDAPPLPLPGCDYPRCECSYFAIPGRRSGKDRRSGVDRRESVRFDDKPDRRSGQDRRRGGKDPWRGRA